MSWHGIRLRRIRRLAGLEPLPDFLQDGAVPGFWQESVDPRFYSAGARYWLKEVERLVADGYVLPKSERETYKLVCKAKNDPKVPVPTEDEMTAFSGAMMWAKAQMMSEILLERYALKNGLAFGPDNDAPDGEEPEVSKLPSKHELYFRWASDSFGVSKATVKSRYYYWRKQRQALESRMVRGPA